MIILCPGHDSINQGASRGDYSEHPLMQALVGKVALECHRRGIKVCVIDQDAWLWNRDYKQRMRLRIDCINAIQPDYVFEFHMNTISKEEQWQDKITGFSILVHSYSGKSVEMDAVNTLLYHTHPLTREVKFLGWKQRPDLAVLRKTKCKAFLFECGYLDNKHDLDYMLYEMDSWAEFIVDCIEAILERMNIA